MPAAYRVDQRSRPALQGGGALLMLLIIMLMAATYTLIGGVSSNALKVERQEKTSVALARAKEALIGFAVTYRDNHAGEVFGLFPCPDTDNDGFAEISCMDKDVSVIGRLPWKTLGIPPLRDEAGECLWYAVSGHAKASSPRSDTFTWDTIGQFAIQDAGGAVISGSSAHENPLVVIFSPHQLLGTQSRTSSGTSECGGTNNDNAANYLEGLGALATTTPAPNAISTLILSNPDSIRNGTNNDQGLWITSKEIFDPIKKRGDFKTDMDTLMSDLVNYLNTRYSTISSDQNRLSATAIANFRSAYPQSGVLLTNWSDNVLYAKGNFTVNGSPTICPAILVFSGERTVAQRRASTEEIALVSNYLEAPNTGFPADGSYTGATVFDSSTASRDIVRCIGGYAAQASFANDFASFTTAGVAVTTNTSVPSAPTVTIADATGSAGGCFWLPRLIPIAGKTLRAYYDYQFGYADPTGSPDRGNGFTFQMVQGTNGPPTACGTETNAGALGTADLWGSMSFIVETDVFRTTSPTTNDPSGNHTAIMLNGTNVHPAGTGTGTNNTACDGSSNVCRHSPTNKFEEGVYPPPPAPPLHNQRIEIHTGCDSTCSSCNPASHGTTNFSAKIRVWVDCLDCSDVVADYVPPGAELITAAQDRDFSASGNWTGSNWSVIGGLLTHTAAGANAVSLPISALNRSPADAFNYQVSATVNTTASGRLTFSLGGSNYTTANLGAGSTTTVSATISASTGSPLSITPNAAWRGTIDNVSLVPKPAIIERCVSLASPMDALNSIYFGLTGGFRSTATTMQSVTFTNFSLRSD